MGTMNIILKSLNNVYGYYEHYSENVNLEISEN